MGPHGTGFLYLTEELQSRIQQSSLGWLAAEDPWKFYDYDQPLAGSARRYEGGSLNMPGLWGLHAAIRTILEFGPERIESHLHAINGIVIDCLRNVDGCRVITPSALPERAGIVSIELRTGINAGSVMEYLGEHNITIAVREGKLRYSPHFYVSAEEMRQVADLTAGFLRRSV
jgi:selenocysteine lyase/cysteine desulfurase